MGTVLSHPLASPPGSGRHRFDYGRTFLWYPDPSLPVLPSFNASRDDEFSLQANSDHLSVFVCPGTLDCTYFGVPLQPRSLPILFVRNFKPLQHPNRQCPVSIRLRKVSLHPG